MAKFNFFKGGNKEELKPSEIQQQIDERKDRIEDLENEIRKTDDFLSVIADNQKNVVRSRKEEIENKEDEVNQRIEKLDFKKEAVSKKRAIAVDKTGKGLKKADKIAHESVEKINEEKSLLDKEYELKKQNKANEVNKYKKEQDKKSEEKRNQLIAETNKKKHEYTDKASKDLEKQRTELKKLREEIKENEVNFAQEIQKLEEKLGKELEKQKINQDTYNQKMENLKTSQDSVLSEKYAEVDVKFEQWEQDFNRYALVNQEFIERKKTELEQLKNKEHELEVFLKQEKRSAELERKKLENEHRLKIEELNKLSATIDQKLASAQLNYESENNLYEKEVMSFQQVCKDEQEKTESLINKLGNELNQYKEEISKQCIDLEVQFKNDCDSISEFYRNHLINEEEKLQKGIHTIEDDIRRDEENYYIDKKSLEEKRSILENKYLQTIQRIKNDLVKCNEVMKHDDIEHQNKIQSITNDFLNQKSKLEEEIELKEKEINQNKERVYLEVKNSEESVKNQLQQLEQTKKGVDKELESINQRLSLLNDEMSAVIKDKENEINALSMKLNHLNQDLISFNEKRTQEKVRHDNRIGELAIHRQQIIDEHNKKKNEIKIAYDLKVKELEEVSTEKKKEIVENHEHKLIELRTNHDEKSKELEQVKVELLQQFEKEKIQYTDRIQELEKELLTKVKNEEEKLKQTEQDIASQKMKQDEEIARIHQAHQDSFSVLKEKIQNQLASLKTQDEEYRFEISVKLEKARDDVRRLKSEENSLVEQMAVLQNKFNEDKNNLVRSTSAYVDQHLEKVANLENQIAIKKEENHSAENSLQELIQFYMDAEKEEQEKLARLKGIFAREEIDQNQELEMSIVQLEAQRNNKLDVLRARFESDRKLFVQQLNDEIAVLQSKIEDEKQTVLEEQEHLDKQYENKVKENKIIVDGIKKEIEQFQEESILERRRFDSEKNKLEKANTFDKKQLEYELELKNSNHLQKLEELRNAFEQDQNEINLEKMRVANAIELKQKALNDRKQMFDNFFENFELEENLRKNEREKELSQYDANIAAIEQQANLLQEELETTKSTNHEKIEEIKNLQRVAQAEIDDLVTLRNERFKEAIEKVKLDHEREINEFMSQCNAQQAELTIQNENIIKSYHDDFSAYKSTLMADLEKKQLDMANLINDEETKLNELKEKFEIQFKELRDEENGQIEQRKVERSKFTEQWDEILQAIRNRISAAVNQFSKDEGQLRVDNEVRIQALNDERLGLESEERKILQRIQDLETAFNERKREAEEKSRHYEEECYQKIAEIESLIKQKENKINTYHEDIKQEMLRAIELRKVEEKRLNDIVLSKNQLLADEHEKISTVIQKQQKIFDKLAAKKRSVMENENSRNNKVLEKELRRIEQEKDRVGEEFALSLDELERIIQEKEGYYENLIAEQKIKNEEYLEEFRKTLQKNHNQQVLDSQNELEIAMKMENDLLINENETLENINQEISKIKNDHLGILDSLQKSNNQVSDRLNLLRKQYDQINTDFLSELDSQKYLDFFEDFDQKITERREYLNKLENEEVSLRKERLEQLAEQNVDSNRVIAEHQERVIEIENEIYKEQRRLTDFEEEMSNRRREQKELEIYKKNLFVKKLDYLKQKMFDN